jgi:nucleoid-associated protein YgaU
MQATIGVTLESGKEGRNDGRRFEANKGILKNPDLIKTGQKLRIR